MTIFIKTRSLKFSIHLLPSILLLLAFTWTTFAHATEVWETPEGRACIDRWMADAEARLQATTGTREFEQRKPWRFNQYGLIVGRGAFSNYAPEGWSECGGSRYCWVWRNNDYGTGFGPRWPVWQQAGIPSLREYCEGVASGSSLPPGSTNPGAFGGTWDCPGRGTLTLTRQGTSISGTFTWNGGGTVTGRINGNRMELDARENRGPTSRWVMDLSSNGSRIDGTWFWSNGNFGGRWNCERSRTAVPPTVTPPASPPPPAQGPGNFNGTWNCPGRGTLTLTQQGRSVTGRFSWNGGGSVTGNTTGNRIDLDAREDRGPTSSWTLFMSADGRTMDGTWSWGNGNFGGQWECAR